MSTRWVPAARERPAWRRGLRWLRTHPDVDRVWLGMDPLRRSYGMQVTLACGLTAVISAGGDPRVSAPGFATIRALGSWPVWSSLLGVVAASLLVARVAGAQWMRRALWLAALIYALFAVAFLVSAVQSPVTAMTGPIAYGVLSAWHISTTLAYPRTVRKRDRREAPDDPPARAA